MATNPELKYSQKQISSHFTEKKAATGKMEQIYHLQGG